MIFILKIKDRFSELPYQSKRLQFVALQIELINNFHMRICQIIRDETKLPFGKIYLGALNAVNYIIMILEAWKNSTVCQFLVFALLIISNTKLDHLSSFSFILKCII